jgi:hypothetical protein
MPTEPTEEEVTPEVTPSADPYAHLSPEEQQALSDERRANVDALIAERARQARGPNAPPGAVVFHPNIAGGAWLDVRGYPIPEPAVGPGPTELALAASREAASDALVEKIGPGPLFELDEQFGLMAPADYEKVQAQRAAYVPRQASETEEERAELRKAERARMRAHLLGGGK